MDEEGVEQVEVGRDLKEEREGDGGRAESASGRQSDLDWRMTEAEAASRGMVWRECFEDRGDVVIGCI